MIQIAVFVSGGGTNLQALIDAEQAGRIHSGHLALVVASKPGVYALERAERAGIPSVVVSRKDCAGQAEFEEKILAALNAHHIDMIVLAGFLSILSADFTRRWPNRILNVHPALIPSFCGKGYYGLKVHEAALAYGVKVTGATVHYVNEKERSSSRRRWRSSPATRRKPSSAASWNRRNGFSFRRQRSWWPRASARKGAKRTWTSTRSTPPKN